MEGVDILLVHRGNIFLWIILGIAIYYSISQVRIPLNKRMPKDLIRLKQAVSYLWESLIPWEKKEIELLSLNRTEKTTSSKKNGFESIGAFESIYQELIFSYGYKVYPTKGNYAVLYAQTKRDELFYYEYPNEIEVQLNGLTLGRLIDGKLYGNDGSMLANFLDNAIESYTAVVIGNKDLGHILRPGAYSNDVNPRALDLVEGEMTKEENAIFLAMVIWKIVKDNVKS